MKHGPWNGFCGRKFSPTAIAGMIVGGLALAIVFAFLFGWLVMLLWNWLMPAIFGLPLITYWQGWGLVLLSHILVKGGWGSGGHGDRHERPHDSGAKSFRTRGDARPESGTDERMNPAESWCENCDTCDNTESCRPYAHGWIRTAYGWKQEPGENAKGSAEN